MADYQDLGPVTVVGVSDANYSLNPFLNGTGWDVIVSASATILHGAWPTLVSFECYQISLDGPVGSSVLMSRNRVPWNYVIQGWQNYDDPEQPILLRNGDEIEFCWNTAYTAGPYTASGGSNVQPTVTMWLRASIGTATGG